MNKLTVKQIKARLDRVVSAAVRYGDDSDRCYTCGKKIDPKENHCGHFIGRSCRTLRYHPDNVRLQCVACNTYNAGNLARYYRHLKADGIDADKLLAIEDEWKKGKLSPPKYAELKDYYDYWLAEVRKIEKEKKLNLIPKSW